MSSEQINLSLISHTNAGKTTLARTLLGQDIGEVRDAAHVTDVAEAYPMLTADDGAALVLWDTPGFGDTGRLLRRLKLSGNPLGWLLSQVWDRYADRPFWCSQQAIRNARDNADVVLYLVNASEDPADAGYVGLEMQIMAWIGKPVIVLLNQMGPPRQDAGQDEDAWRRHLRDYSAVREVMAMDAFARCWVQDGALFQKVTSLVPAEKSQAMERLAQAWSARNLARFHASMQILGRQLARAACDRELLPGTDRHGRLQNLARAIGRKDSAGEQQAMRVLSERLDADIRQSTDELIREHGLGGQAAKEVLRRLRENFATTQVAREGVAAMLGGLTSGAMGGLAADLAAGGLTFGGGMIAGGILGALGAGGLARGYNLVRGEKEAAVRWSEEFFTGLIRSALLRYLAVAHFGRGRGDYAASEYPAFWQEAVAIIVESRRQEIQDAYRRGKAGASPDELAEQVTQIMTTCATRLLKELYPAATIVF